MTAVVSAGLRALMQRRVDPKRRAEVARLIKSGMAKGRAKPTGEKSASPPFHPQM